MHPRDAIASGPASAIARGRLVSDGDVGGKAWTLIHDVARMRERNLVEGRPAGSVTGGLVDDVLAVWWPV